MCLIFYFHGCDSNLSVSRRDLCLLHQKFDLVECVFRTKSLFDIADLSIITADDLSLSGFAADLIITDAVADHIHAHVCRRLVSASAVDALKHGL